MRGGIPFAFVLAAVMTLPSAAADTVSTGDASGPGAAVSVFGDASADAFCTAGALTTDGVCVAVSASLMGNASSRCKGAGAQWSTCGVVALAGGDSAAHCDGQTALGCGMLAASLLGDASTACTSGAWARACAASAASAGGDASTLCGGTAFWEPRACALLTVSGAGSAAARCHSGPSFGQNCVLAAVSGDDALVECGDPATGYGSDHCKAIAISLFGDAKATCQYDFWTISCHAFGIDVAG